MRTTLVIEDGLFRLLKKRAHEEGKTLSKIVEDALRGALLPKETDHPKFRLKWRTFRGRMLPGVDIADRDSLYNRMEGRS